MKENISWKIKMDKFYKFNIEQTKANTRSDKKYLDLLVNLNRKTESKIQKKYLSFLSVFDGDNDGRLDNSNVNLSKIGGQIKWLTDNIFTPYKSKFLKISKESGKAIEKQQNDYFKKRNKILKDSGIEIKSGGIYTKNFSGIINKLDKNTVIQLNTVIDKWSKFYYDTLFRGITQQQTIQKVIENLITPNGHIRIGSSFSQSTEANMLMSQVAKRTAFVQADAKKQGLDAVWNANPMDRRTKPICMRASLAGVISEQAMADEYGFPPRWLCRCDAVYTRSEWTEINQGINQGIEERRLKLIDMLKTDPASFQKSVWFIGKGKNKKKVVPKDAKRSSGELYYKSIDDTIKLLEKDVYEIIESENIINLQKDDIIKKKTRGHIYLNTKDKSEKIDIVLSDAKNFGKEMTKEHAEKIVDAVNDFSNKWYKKIRHTQMGLIENTEAMEKAKLIEEYIKISPRYTKNETIYRGMRYKRDEMDLLQPGDILLPKAMASYSSDLKIAKNFSGGDGVILRLKDSTNKGISIKHISSYADEEEILMSGTAKFKITGKEIIDNRLFIDIKGVE